MPSKDDNSESKVKLDDFELVEWDELVAGEIPDEDNINA